MMLMMICDWGSDDYYYNYYYIMAVIDKTLKVCLSDLKCLVQFGAALIQSD